MQIFNMLAAQPLLLGGVALLLGLLVGSFLNVVIYRLPLMLERQWRADSREMLELEAEEQERFNLVLPRSRCSGCGTLIKAWQNIPILSWMLLRGRCASCGTRISAQYPLVELLTGLVTLMVVMRFGLSPAGIAAILLSWALIALAVIDFNTTLLPDDITLPLLWLGLLLNAFNVFTDLHSAVIGAAVGYLVLWSVYWLFKLISGKEGMGYGDFKLLAALGAWLGWEMLPLIVLLSSLVGAVIGVALIVLRGRDRNIPIPFGPYLAIAGWIALLWGGELTRQYLLALG
jgi:leader peptidase (prepilin peptidase)/N-methyltransferase